MENKTLLLQSGGRDSAAAAVNLLESGGVVMGITLASNANANIELPRQRALEISAKYGSYAWNMVDFSEWDENFKREITNSLSDQLPKSCLLCALSKITAVIPICQSQGIRRIAMGYTEYQSSWAEQTPLAIELQRKHLKQLGIELVLPAFNYKAKGEIKDVLIASDLSSESLENPCCISEWGTQPVSEALIEEAITKGFEFLEGRSPVIEVVSSVGEEVIA